VVSLSVADRVEPANEETITTACMYDLALGILNF